MNIHAEFKLYILTILNGSRKEKEKKSTLFNFSHFAGIPDRLSISDLIMYALLNALGRVVNIQMRVWACRLIDTGEDSLSLGFYRRKLVLLLLVFMSLNRLYSLPVITTCHSNKLPLLSQGHGDKILKPSKKIILIMMMVCF